MSKKRSDALQALVAELVDAERTVDDLRHIEEEARQESIAARQVLDDAIARTKAATGRVTITAEALGLIQRRDDISEETVDALRARARE